MFVAKKTCEVYTRFKSKAKREIKIPVKVKLQTRVKLQERC